MRIGCLHTADGNVAVLERAAARLGDVALRHMVRADLLQAAGQAGGVTAAIARETRMAVGALADDCDAVLLTCSSLGGVIDGLGDAPVPMLRIDRALAEHAVAAGGKVIVLCTAPTSLEPTGNLFRAAARQTGAQIELRLVPDAWADFLAGDGARYHARIADAVAAALAESAATVALAQVSMAEALGSSPRVLTSPAIGLAAAAMRVSSCR
jgi:hypothetical protein